MKLNKLFLGLGAAATVFFTGCASNNLALSNHSPIAIIGVEGNPSIYLVDENYNTDEDEGGVLSASVNKFIEANNPEFLTAQDRVDYGEEYLRIALTDLAGAEVLDRDFVTSSDDYVYAKGNGLLGFMDPSISATNYQKNMMTIGAKKARMLMDALGAKGLVSAKFEFDKKKGSNSITAVVKMKVNFIDNRGKNIISKDYMAESTESVRTIGGKYNKDEFVELFPATIESVINKFVVEYIE